MLNALPIMLLECLLMMVGILIGGLVDTEYENRKAKESKEDNV